MVIPSTVGDSNDPFSHSLAINKRRRAGNEGGFDPIDPDTFFPLRVVIPDCAEIPGVNGILRRCAGGARYNAQ
ncbi:hypothetical protein ACLKQF_13705, partial [Aeromonas salmonicida]